MGIKPVILCGGSGSRLWPLSRAQFPKQLIDFEDGESLLQKTSNRSQALKEVLPVEFICNSEYRFLVAQQLASSNLTQYSIVLEPVARNTAPAIAIAAFRALDEDPVLLVMPSDHLIEDEKQWAEAVALAKKLAEAGRVVTFGVPPLAPETGYGYIKKGEAITGGGYAIDRFVEKPDRLTAEDYLQSGDYLWNAGMFAFKASVFLKELKTYEPNIFSACEQAANYTTIDLDFVRIPDSEFRASPSQSVDYAVMERTSRGVTVPMNAGWTDVGSFDALWQVSKKDDKGNVVTGDVLLEGSHDNYVHADKRLVSLLGVKDLVVVETADVVMVADRSRSQEVKTIVEQLNASGRSEASSHQRVYRPWGFYETIEASDRYQVKLIEVSPGASLSLQLHHHRAEHWIVVNGTAEVTRGDEQFQLSENESTYIPLGTRHRLENPGRVPLRIIEIQSGSYLGEDDIVRFDDKYGRGGQ